MVEKSENYTSNFIKRISKQIPSAGLSLKEFIELIGEEGILLVCLILVAPFLIPISIPGSSLPFGLAIILLNISTLLGGRYLLPGRVMQYKISQKTMIRILDGMKTVLSGLERFLKPRLHFITDHPSIEYLNSIIIILCAFWLMLPLPIPLTDFLPAYSILFLLLGSLERDGILILAGYVLATVTTVYFVLIAFLGWGAIKLVTSYLGFPI